MKVHTLRTLCDAISPSKPFVRAGRPLASEERKALTLPVSQAGGEDVGPSS